MLNQDRGCLLRKRRCQPFEEQGSGTCAYELSGDESDSIGWPYPGKVFVMERASVTAGLANDVEAVNQYAAAMYSPTAKGTVEGRLRTHPQMTVSSPKVATNSLSR